MGNMYWSANRKLFFQGKLEGKNISRMPNHVLMDQTLQNMCGHLAIAEILIILVSKTKNLQAWHTSAPSILTIYSKTIPNQCSILFKKESRAKSI